MEKPSSVPAEYDEAINKVIEQFATFNQPRFKGFIKITVRPQGLRSCLHEEMYCMDKDPNSYQRIFERFCRLLNRAKNHFGKKDFLFEIVNAKGDSLTKIRVDISRRICDAMTRPTSNPTFSQPSFHVLIPDSTFDTSKTIAPEPLQAEEHEPASAPPPPFSSKPPQPPSPPEPAAPLPHVQALPVQPRIRSPRAHRRRIFIPDPPLAVEVAPEPSSANGTIELVACPNRDESIDFQSMKFFPTEATPGNIRKAFEACGIRTNGDILGRLGTLEPSRLEWDIFIREIRSKAKTAKINFWPSSDGTLYWWLTKKMRWVRKFPTQ